MDQVRELIFIAIGAAYSTPENVNKQVDVELASAIADRLIETGLASGQPIRKSTVARESSQAAPPRNVPKVTAGMHRYQCTDCQTQFKSDKPTLDLTCPNCQGVHIEPRKNQKNT